MNILIHSPERWWILRHFLRFMGVGAFVISLYLFFGRVVHFGPFWGSTAVVVIVMVANARIYAVENENRSLACTAWVGFFLGACVVGVAALSAAIIEFLFSINPGESVYRYTALIAATIGGDMVVDDWSMAGREVELGPVLLVQVLAVAAALRALV